MKKEIKNNNNVLVKKRDLDIKKDLGGFSSDYNSENKLNQLEIIKNNKIPYKKNKQIKNLYRGININNKEAYHYNDKNSLTYYQKNNIINELIPIIFEQKYIRINNYTYFQRTMIINKIQYSQINNTINLLNFKDEYSSLIINPSKNILTLINISYYKGNINKGYNYKRPFINNNSTLSNRLQILKHLISLTNKDKQENWWQNTKILNMNLKSYLSNTNNSTNPGNWFINNSKDNLILNYLILIKNISLMNQQVISRLSFNSLNKLTFNKLKKEIKHYLEYYLILIYKNNVVIHLNELTKPYLDPVILGKYLILYLSNKKTSLKTSRNWIHLNNLLNRKLRISKSILPIIDNNNNIGIFRGKYLMNLDQLNYLKNKTLSFSSFKTNSKKLKNKSIRNSLKNFLITKKDLNLFLLFDKIGYSLKNFIKFKSLLGVHLTLSGRFSRRKIASRAISTKFYNGYSKYSVNNVLNPFLKPKNNLKFNEDFIRIYTTNKNGAICLKIKMNYTK